MASIPQDNLQDFADSTESTHVKQQSKDYFDETSSTQFSTGKKRKRQDLTSEPKRMKLWNKPLSNQRTDNGCYDPVDPAASDEALGSPSSDSIQPRLPSEILDLETKEIESSHPVDTFGLTGFSYPAFVLPGELFDFPSDEQKVPLEPSLADVADKTNSTVGNDLPSVLRPQHSRRLWSRCDTAMARRTYNELDDIIVRISTIMQNIESLIGEDFYGVDDHCSCTSTESSRIIYDACGELEPHDSP